MELHFGSIQFHVYLYTKFEIYRKNEMYNKVEITFSKRFLLAKNVTNI